MDTQPYTRVLLKLSGEQLAGKFDNGIDVEFGAWLAGEVKKVVDSGAQVVIMVGGGNYARGIQLTGHSIQRVTADNIGMLATMMNGLALADIFNTALVPARVVTTIKADQIADQFTHRRAVSHLQKGRVVIVAGGIGRPYLTTDTAAVSLALELDCQVVLKATKVDGVYDKDPAQFPDAVKIDQMTFQKAVVDDNIKVMDKAAMGLALEHHLPIIVFNACKPDNIRQAVLKQPVGTTISD
jgi:uridylate kinase